MSRIAPPAEKITAVAAIYKALSQEMQGELEQLDPRVQVQMLATATTIAMYTDTRDMGILAPVPFDGGPTVQRIIREGGLPNPMAPGDYDIGENGAVIPGYDPEDPYARE